MKPQKTAHLSESKGNAQELPDIENRTVGFLDILGFKDKISTVNLAELAHKYERLIVQTDAANRPVGEFSDHPRLFPNHPIGSPYCHRFIFSDSIILISLDDSEESSLKLVIYFWRLMQTMLATGFLPRGAISFGDMYINSDHQIFLGTALTEAAVLEGLQEWSGACLHPSLTEKFPNVQSLPMITKYDVPLKNQSQEELYTVNWRFNLIVENGTGSLFLDNDDPRVLRKKENFLAYAKLMRKKGAYIKNENQLPVELRSCWIGGKEPPFPHGDEY